MACYRVTFTFTDLQRLQIKQYKCLFFFLNDNLGNVKTKENENPAFYRTLNEGRDAFVPPLLLAELRL